MAWKTTRRKQSDRPRSVIPIESFSEQRFSNGDGIEFLVFTAWFVVVRHFGGIRFRGGLDRVDVVLDATAEDFLFGGSLAFGRLDANRKRLHARPGHFHRHSFGHVTLQILQQSVRRRASQMSEFEQPEKIWFDNRSVSGCSDIWYICDIRFDDYVIMRIRMGKDLAEQIENSDFLCHLMCMNPNHNVLLHASFKLSLNAHWDLSANGRANMENSRAHK